MYQQKPFQSIDRLLKDQNGNKNLNSFHQPPKLELESETIGSSKIKVEIGSSKREVEVDSTMDQSNPVARKRQKLDVCAESSTCYKLLNMASHGHISICGAVDLANSMVDDGMIHPAIENFATLGSQNQYPANAERDLHRWLRNLFGFRLQPYTVWMNLTETQFLLDVNSTLEIAQGNTLNYILFHT